jgi:PadR family transcriptional regulator PadR
MDTTQLLKGVLDLAVLAAVSGLVDVGDASVYGTLRRLYAAGALTSYVVPSDEGPHRKYYGINAHGRATLETQSKTWADFAETMNGLLPSGTATKETR